MFSAMLRSWALICVAVAAPGGLGHAGETTAPLFHSSATESITVLRDPVSGAGMTRQVSVNYHQLSYLMPGERDLIAREILTRGYSEATEGEMAEAVVDLFYRRPDQSYSPEPDHTTRVSEASLVKFHQDHWTAKIIGCCDAEPILQLFAYGEGRPFLYSNTQYAQVSLPNANINRYAGVVLRSQFGMDGLEEAVFGRDARAIAAVLYGGPGQVMQKVLLYPRKGVGEFDLPYHTKSIAMESKAQRDVAGYNEEREISKVLLLWSQDTVPGGKTTATLSGFTIKAGLVTADDKSEVISIPVVDDRLGTATLSGTTLSLKPE